MAVRRPREIHSASTPQPSHRQASSLPSTFAELGVPDALIAPLAAAGVTSPFPIQTATLPDNSIWHRVRLGPYTNAQDLDKARAALKENKIDNAVIKVNEPLAKR